MRCTCCDEKVEAKGQCLDHDRGYGVCDRCLVKYGRYSFCLRADCPVHGPLTSEEAERMTREFSSSLTGALAWLLSLHVGGLATFPQGNPRLTYERREFMNAKQATILIKMGADNRVPRKAIGYIYDLTSNCHPSIRLDRLNMLNRYIPDLVEQYRAASDSGI